MGAGLSQDETSGSQENLSLPHSSQQALKPSNPPVDGSSIRKPLQQNKNRKKISTVQSRNSFTLSAQDLSITWGEDIRHWHWYQLEEPSEEGIVVAKALSVSWLEVRGRFDTAKLSPGMVYEVVFVVMLEETAYGWKVPVNLRLTLPDGRKQEHKEDFTRKPREKWIEVPAGVFETTAENIGEIEFSLYEFEGGNWKKGLIIKEISFKPKP